MMAEKMPGLAVSKTTRIRVCQFGNTEYCILGNGEYRRDNRKTHGQADHQRVALIETDTQFILQPTRHIAAEEPVLEYRADLQRQQGGHNHYRHEQRGFPAVRNPAAQFGRQEVPEVGDQQDNQRSHEKDRENTRQVRLDQRRQPEPGQKAENNRRQGFHDFDGRLDHTAHFRSHEIGGEYRPQNSQGNGKQHGVESRLQGTECQGCQAELRFEIVIGGR